MVFGVSMAPNYFPKFLRGNTVLTIRVFRSSHPDWWCTLLRFIYIHSSRDSVVTDIWFYWPWAHDDFYSYWSVLLLCSKTGYTFIAKQYEMFLKCEKWKSVKWCISRHFFNISCNFFRVLHHFTRVAFL